MGANDHALVARAIRYLVDHAREQPALGEVAAEVGLSEFHFQRVFQREAGVSPKRFLQSLTLRDAKAHLARQRSLLETSLEVGLSGPSRLHDLFLSLERITPGEWQQRARGLTVAWDVAETPLGRALFAGVERGLCGLSFVDSEAEARRELEARWPQARTRRDPAALRPHVEQLLARLRGGAGRPLGLVLKGSPLQLKVWEALLAVPEGAVVTYGELARAAGMPAAVRAVATAVGQNPLAVLVPCHRVIRSTGAFGGYRWGLERKATLLALEGARAAAPA